MQYEIAKIYIIMQFDDKKVCNFLQYWKFFSIFAAIYLFDGGFPELMNLSKPEQEVYVRSLVKTIIEKDIARRYKIRYVQTLTEIANQVLDEFTDE